MKSKLALLAPMPQKLRETGAASTLGHGTHIVLLDGNSELLTAAQLLQGEFEAQDIETSIISVARNGGFQIILEVNPHLCTRPQGYRLLAEPTGVYIAGADAAGAFYGACTLCQLIRLYADSDGSVTLPGLHIEDWPDFANRGVMLDISRDRVPTMDTLYDLVVLLAGLKINQLQLYTEHTFAYVGHEVIWEHASPMTAQEVLELDAYCRTMHIEFVPNQNSFGHMHRWLTHEAYRPLAESPEGVQHPFSPQREPYSICPTDPGSLALLEDLFAQLLPNFTSRQFNVGLDETFDLGLGRSKAICDEKGVGVVYVDFLKQIHALVRSHGRTMQFWSDIIVRDEPELAAALPQDVIALEWGYEADYPFAEHAELIARSGRSFYVCPGTGSWNTLAGRTANALGNMRNAASNGFRHGAIGYLNTDWGDHGHIQPLPVSYLGYLAGAAMSWNVASAEAKTEPDWAAMLDAHVFEDSAGVMGKLAYDLGLAYLEAGAPIGNSSPLFWLAILPDALPERRIPADLSVASLERTLAYIDQVMAPMDREEMAILDRVLVLAEWEFVAGMLRWACRVGIARLGVGLDKPIEAVDEASRKVLANELDYLIERHCGIWLQRSRIGGLDDSSGRLETMLERLLTPG